MKNNNIELSIIIPIYNSQKIIGESLSTISDWIRKQNINIELIAVDDGSTDQTRQIINEFASKIDNYEIISYEKNKGKGYAVKKGLKVAKGEYILFTDADLSYGLDIIARMYEHIKNHSDIDLLYGSRHHEESDYGEYGIIRKIGRLFFSTYTRWVTSLDVFDTQCGIKIMTKKLADMVKDKITIDGFAFDIELFTIARANKLKYSEFPVVLENHDEGSIRIFRDTSKMIVDIFKIRINHKKGLYKNHFNL